MKELVQKDDVVAYLRGLAAASMLVVSMVSPVLDISSTIKSAYEMATVVENFGQYLGEGPYWIESKQVHKLEDAASPDLPYSGYAFAITIQAKILRSGAPVGGHHTLRASLSGYEYLQIERQDPNDMVTSILIKMPSDPVELQNLRQILSDSAVFFSIDDGSGVFHLGNSMMGSGIYRA